MLVPSSQNPFRHLLVFFLGYLRSLASIPAILLQALCLFLGACGLFSLLFSAFPHAVDPLIVTIMKWFGVEHVAWSANPIPGILHAYFLLGLILDAGAWILKTYLHVKWEWSAKKTILTLTMFSGINCAVMATGLAQSGRSDFGVPLFILFLLTFFTTLFTVTVGKTLDAIESAVRI